MEISKEEFSEVLHTILASQQPFYATLTAQIAALESREAKRDEAIQHINTSLALLAQANTAGEVAALEGRVAALEAERSERNGIAKALEMGPKLFGWCVILVGIILGYLKFGNGVL